MKMNFDTYREAYNYYALHKNEVKRGFVLVISQDGHSVYERPVSTGHECVRSDHRAGIYHGFGRDHLGEGVKGVLNHADGKRYDSKSQYERAVRAKGCRIVGNDFNNAKPWQTPLERGVRGDFNVRPQLKEAVQKVLGC